MRPPPRGEHRGHVSLDGVTEGLGIGFGGRDLVEGCGALRPPSAGRAARHGHPDPHRREVGARVLWRVDQADAVPGPQRRRGAGLDPGQGGGTRRGTALGDELGQRRPMGVGDGEPVGLLGRRPRGDGVGRDVGTTLRSHGGVERRHELGLGLHEVTEIVAEAIAEHLEPKHRVLPDGARLEAHADRGEELVRQRRLLTGQPLQPPNPGEGPPGLHHLHLQGQAGLLGSEPGRPSLLLVSVSPQAAPPGGPHLLLHAKLETRHGMSVESEGVDGSVGDLEGHHRVGPCSSRPGAVAEGGAASLDGGEPGVGSDRTRSEVFFERSGEGEKRQQEEGDNHGGGYRLPAREDERLTHYDHGMLKLLVDPRIVGAYFAEHLDVVQAEIAARFPGLSMAIDRRATLTFVDVDLPREAARDLVRLSGVQGAFEARDGLLEPLDADPGYGLPADLVFAAKYRGKTHELVTQLALNLALDTCTVAGPIRVLDPMAGRGTTLFWAARYGWTAWGVEQDPRALDDVQRHVKRQTQLHRLKHGLAHGWTGPKRKDGVGRFLEVRFGEVAVRLVIGDTRRLRDLVGPGPFSLVVADLPYGVQHTGRDGTRNPLAVLEACAPVWTEVLAPGGAMVLVFNRLQPRREALERLFVAQGLEVRPFDVAHRMSESIWRDLLVLYRPA